MSHNFGSLEELNPPDTLGEFPHAVDAEYDELTADPAERLVADLMNAGEDADMDKMGALVGAAVCMRQQAGMVRYIRGLPADKAHKKTAECMRDHSDFQRRFGFRVLGSGFRPDGSYGGVAVAEDARGKM